MKGSEARTKQSEDILKLKTDSAAFREGLAAADTSLRSLTTTSANQGRKLEAAAYEALQTAAHITELRQQTTTLLNTVRCFYRSLSWQVHAQLCMWHRRLLHRIKTTSSTCRSTVLTFKL
jgi:hypothetical protein